MQAVLGLRADPSVKLAVTQSKPVPRVVCWNGRCFDRQRGCRLAWKLASLGQYRSKGSTSSDQRTLRASGSV